MVFSSLVTRACSRLNSVADSVGAQADEPLDEVAEQQHAPAGLGVHPHHGMLGLVVVGDELLAVLRVRSSASVLGVVDVARRSRTWLVCTAHRFSARARSGAGSCS